MSVPEGPAVMAPKPKPASIIAPNLGSSLARPPRNEKGWARHGTSVTTERL